MQFLKWLWKKWLPIAQAIGNFQGQLILTIFYFVVIFPPGIGFRLFSDPLRIRKKIYGTNFGKWQHSKDTLESAHKQY